LGPLSAEVIVVDNASTDDSLSRVQAFPGLRLVRRSDNPGFAVATNQAARLATGRRLLLLNPDTECAPGAIERLSAFLDAHPDVAAAGPRLVHPDGAVQRSCWQGFPDLGSAVIEALYLWKLPTLPVVRRRELAPSRLRQPLDVDHLLGACVLVPRTVWGTVGPLDESFFLFFEETEWCRRARRAGYRICYVPEGTVTHLGEHSVYQVPGRSLPQYYRSYARFLRLDRSGEGRIALLKGIVALAAVVRMALWGLRLAGPRRQLARRMLAGYGRVLADLPTY
jgi:GT2 family glycosyltransferase